ncbi:MAG: TolC family protein [bacterium]|nr:TolC family protein [bacterium]
MRFRAHTGIRRRLQSLTSGKGGGIQLLLRRCTCAILVFACTASLSPQELESLDSSEDSLASEYFDTPDASESSQDPGASPGESPYAGLDANRDDSSGDASGGEVDEENILGLADAERIAESNNFDLRVLNMERDIAEDTVDARFRDYFPSLSFSYRRNRTIARRDFDNGNHSLQVSLSQPVFDGGRTQLAHEVSKIDARLARERITESKNQLRFQVRQQYLQLVQEKENISIARAAYESARATLDRATVENRQGAITELDFQEIRTEYDRRGLELEQRVEAYENGRVDFAQLLRVSVDPELDNRPDVKGLDLFRVRVNEFSMSIDELYNIAMESRPDVRQAKIDVMRSRREYLITKYDWLPTVSLTGNYGKSGEEWPPTNTEWGVGINFTFRVFGNTISTDAQELRTQNETGRGYSSSGQWNVYDNAAWEEPHKRNTIELMQARDRKQQLADTVRVEVTRLRRAFYDRRREMELADRSLAVREQRFRIEQLRFRNGEISVSDYLESELELIQARLDLVAGRVNMILAANQTEIDLGLPLDSLKLVDIAEIGSEDSQLEPGEGVSSGYRTHTKLKLPNAPFEISEEGPVQETGESDQESNSGGDR